MDKMTVAELCKVIASHPACRMKPRSTPAAFPFAVDEDWTHVYGTYELMEIFCGANPVSQNGWRLELGRTLTPLSGFCGSVFPESLWDYFNEWYVIAIRAGDGADVVAINANKDANFGKVLFATLTEGLGSRVPLVANSFHEWLERTLHAGEDSEAYFFKADFCDLGPALPDSPDFAGLDGYLNV